MGRLTEFQCPTKKEALTLVGGSPATIGTFSGEINHITFSTSTGSGFLGLDFESQLGVGIYVKPDSNETIDVSTGSIYWYGVGSLYCIGYK